MYSQVAHWIFGCIARSNNDTPTTSHTEETFGFYQHKTLNFKGKVSLFYGLNTPQARMFSVLFMYVLIVDTRNTAAHAHLTPVFYDLQKFDPSELGSVELSIKFKLHMPKSW